MLSLRNNYKSLKHIGHGGFAHVISGISESGVQVALKVTELINNDVEDTISHQSYNSEVTALLTLKHPNIVNMLTTTIFHDALVIELEFVELDLHRVIKGHQELSINEIIIDNLFEQILQGVAFIHEKGFAHRDLKPANILVTSDMKVKIADFGLATKVVQGQIPFEKPVVTRWYRAPELILKFPFYGQSIDIWSLGCIYAEMKLKHVLWPSRNGTEQFYFILQTLGTPENWKEFDEIKKDLLIPCFPEPSTDFDFLKKGIFNGLFEYDPKKRLTAQEALEIFRI